MHDHFIEIGREAKNTYLTKTLMIIDFVKKLQIEKRIPKYRLNNVDHEMRKDSGEYCIQIKISFNLGFSSFNLCQKKTMESK